MRVEEFLEQSARLTPEKTALVCQEGRFTYAELDRLANRLAGALEREGIRRGDRVAVFLDNSVEAVVSIFGVLKLGAVFLMVNATTKTEKLAYILNNCRAAGLISNGKQRHIAAEAGCQIPSLRVAILTGGGNPSASMGGLRVLHWDQALSEQSDRRPLKAAIDIDLATIIYTSGSTGFPKGVMMTHLSMVTAADSITRYLENTKEDVILSALPLSFDYGLYQVLMGFKVGATVVLEKSFAFPQVILNQLHHERVTGFPLVPTMAALLLQIKTLAPGQFPSLRYITNTAASLPPAHITQLRRLFPSTKLYLMYGLTECKRVSYLPPDQLDARPTSVGKAMPNTEAWIVDEQGRRVGPGIIGELVVRGGHVMAGYWEMEEETAKTLTPGPVAGERLLHTGDLFRADEEGYLYFVGRKDDIIKTRGEKVSPTEVEHVLYGIEDVVEAAVVGVPDEILGQAIKASIVLRQGSTLTDKKILAHCQQHLEDFMVPQYIERRPSLPKTESAKIRKRPEPAAVSTERPARVDQRIARAIAQWPDRTAVVHKNRAWSYAELDGLASAYETRLAAAGLAPGERVILWLENSADYIAAYLAVLRKEGVVTALHAQVLPEEVNRVAQFVGAAGLITASPNWQKGAPELADSPLRFALTEAGSAALSGRSAPPVTMDAPEGLAQIIYTSGSTGQPKGVMLSHANLLANAASIIEYLGLTEWDSVMAVLPFVYAYGNSVMLTHLLTGGKLVIENNFVYPNVVLDRMAGERVTGFSGVASTYALLVNHSALRDYSFPALRYLTHAGGPMPLDLLDRARKAFEGKAFFVMYGQTEATARLTYLPPKELERKRGSAGRPIPGVNIRILGPEGGTLPAGQIGEVAASGDNIMLGYWQSPDQTRQTLDRGWLRTGDIGRLDDEGYLYIIGRNSEIIKSGAFRISPYEIEEVLLRHPEVYEAGVVGMDDPILGETILGVIAPRQGCRPEEQELLAFCAKHLAPYKRPKAILQMDELPKSPSGKILRQAIKEELRRSRQHPAAQANP
jgi:amino acid adenylation domain-containing protein